MARMAPCRSVLAFSLIQSIGIALLSALHAAGAVAAGQLLDVGDVDAVEVADDAVLEAGGRDCELQRLTGWSA